MNNVTFGIDISRWTAKDTAATETIMREAVYELCSRIIFDMPVDKRRPDDVVSKGDWNSGVGREPGDVSRNDPSGEQARGVLREMVNAWKPREGQSFYFANYKDYIMRIEYLGWGGTPPYAPLTKNVINWDDIVAQMARKYGSN
jgi:hypothetical protein